ncbi:MAG: hypothetical protein ABI779_10340 [Acidobacteriota bacterium]
MATVINDLTIEPKAAPPKEAEAAGQGAGGGGKSGPELERELEKLQRRAHDRKLRLWAH